MSKLSYSDDKDNPNVVIAKLQAKADHWHKEATMARALVFDLIYPDYKTEDEFFKQQYIFYKEEVKRVIEQRDKLKDRCSKLEQQVKRLGALIKIETEKEI